MVLTAEGDTPSGIGILETARQLLARLPVKVRSQQISYGNPVEL